MGETIKTVDVRIETPQYDSGMTVVEFLSEI